MTITIPLYILYLSAWFLSGLIGSSIVFYFNRRESNGFYHKGYCPSPISIVGILIGSAVGVIMLVPALVLALVVYSDKPNWWTKPICKKNLTNDD